MYLKILKLIKNEKFNQPTKLAFIAKMMCMMLMGFRMTNVQAQTSDSGCGCTLTADPVSCTIELCCDSRFTFTRFEVEDCELYYPTLENPTSFPVYSGCISFPIIDKSDFTIWVWNYGVNVCPETLGNKQCDLKVQIPATCP